MGKSGTFRGNCGQVVHISIIMVVHFSFPFFCNAAKNKAKTAENL